MVLSSLYGLHQHVCMPGNVRHAPIEMADGVRYSMKGVDGREVGGKVACRCVATDKAA